MGVIVVVCVRWVVVGLWIGRFWFVVGFWFWVFVLCVGICCLSGRDIYNRGGH